MKPDITLLEENRSIDIELKADTFEFNAPDGFWDSVAQIFRNYYLSEVDKYRDRFLENRLESYELKKLVNNLICSDLYEIHNINGVFWTKSTFERDLNAWPYIFSALSDFLIWLSETDRSFVYKNDFKEKIQDCLSHYPNETLNYLILEEKLMDISFFNSLKAVIDLIYRDSESHKRLVAERKIKVYIEPEKIGRTEKQILEKKLENEKLTLELEQLKAQRLKNEELTRQLEEKLTELKQRKSSMDEEVAHKAKEIVDNRMPDELEKIKEHNHKSILDEVFGSHAEPLSKSDLFEKEEAERERRRRLEEVERREFKSEIREQINEHGKTIYEAKSEFKDYTSAHSVEHANEKADNRIAFERLDAKIEKVKIETDIRFIKVESESEKRYIQLESGMEVLKSYVDNFGITINARIDKEISTVGHAIADLKINIKESFMSVEKEFAVRDVRFKEEILNLNENQMKIVGYLETLKNQTENFKQQIQNEMSRALIEIDRKGLTFEEVRATASHLLEKTEILYKGIQVENGGLKNKLEASLGELELGKKSMFVELSKQKLVLEKATQDVYHTAKEVAYGKLDIELLHSEKQQRLNESQSQLNSTLQEIRMKEQEMKSFWANESTRNRLENQIAFLHERSQSEKSHLERRAEEAEFVVRRLRDKNLAY
jgi:hypothetical protein